MNLENNITLIFFLKKIAIHDFFKAFYPDEQNRMQ